MVVYTAGAAWTVNDAVEPVSATALLMAIAATAVRDGHTLRP